jgi:hypothetical protein
VETIECRDWLGFAGIQPAQVRMIYSKVKDLVYLALLIKCGNHDEHGIREGLALTFARRESHVLPAMLTPPPHSWRASFQTWLKSVTCRPRYQWCSQAYSNISTKSYPTAASLLA